MKEDDTKLDVDLPRSLVKDKQVNVSWKDLKVLSLNSLMEEDSSCNHSSFKPNIGNSLQQNTHISSTGKNTRS